MPPLVHNVAIAAAIDLDRLVAWCEDRPRANTRTARFAALAPAHAMGPRVNRDEERARVGSPTVAAILSERHASERLARWAVRKPCLGTTGTLPLHIVHVLLKLLGDLI